MQVVICLDFGGSTIDLVCFKGGLARREYRSFESVDYPSDNLESFLKSINFNPADFERIYVTGGRSRRFVDQISGVPVIRVNEIQAIGRGGLRLADEEDVRAGSFLVVSMGTGTCMVSVRREPCVIEHVGGTGVGGGTFVGLSRKLLGVNRIGEILDLFARGDAGRVDLSVADIVGSGIGRVPADATASNLGRLAREIEFESADLAAGIVNLVGQTIATAAVFAAQANGLDLIVLGGKLTRIKPVCDVIQRTADIYKISLLIPKNAAYVSALGAYEERGGRQDE